MLMLLCCVLFEYKYLVTNGKQVVIVIVNKVKKKKDCVLCLTAM